MKTKDPQRIAYFCDRNPKVLREASPVNLIPQIDVFTENGYTKEEMKTILTYNTLAHHLKCQDATLVQITQNFLVFPITILT